MTYSGAPNGTNADTVRFYCGDTDNTNLLLTDAEVTWSLVEKPNARLAAALCCDALGAKYARKADTTVGEISVSNGNRAQEFRDMASRLRAEAGQLAAPSFGGQSQSEKNGLAQNADAVQPPFSERQFDNPLSRQFDGQAYDPNDPASTGNQ